MRKVLVALRMAGEAGQGKMSGIYRFLSEGHPWNVKIVESTHELTPSAVAEAAFRHLYDQGRFRSYAYIPAKEDERWSYARGAAFANCAASHGIVCHTYSGDIELTAFLKSLISTRRAISPHGSWTG